jgi:hypothetical protein
LGVVFDPAKNTTQHPAERDFFMGKLLQQIINFFKAANDALPPTSSYETQQIHEVSWMPQQSQYKQTDFK